NPKESLRSGEFQCGPVDKDSASGKRSCKFTTQPTFDDASIIPFKVLALADNRLKLSVSFFDAAESPSNNAGYLRLGTSFTESESTTTFEISANISGKLDPDTTSEAEADDDGKVPLLSAENPYRGRDLSRFSGGGELTLGRALGDRAKASLSVEFKDADLGAGEDLDPEVSRYQVDVFGKTGLSLRFGRYRFAKPTSGLAINQSGEGFEFLKDNFSLGLLVGKESLDGKADFENDDSQVLITKVNDIQIGQSGILRSLDLIGLYGEEKRPEQSYDYWTLGCELFFFGSEGISTLRSGDLQKEKVGNGVGSLAFYHSKRDIRDQCEEGVDDPEVCKPEILLRDGEGSSILGSYTYNRLQLDANKFTAKTIWSLTFLAGWGEGDDPDTERNDGYLGENAGYS
ncbi:hypothetical protein AC249_AIPGENE2040, partial [Exaiptasia diaphana]